MDKLIITLAGLVSIGSIYWFFFGKKEEINESSTTWNIAVEGGYKPNTITIAHGKPSVVTFTRKDVNSCLEEIVLPDFKIKKFLPLDTPVAITLSPVKPGTYTMHCGMNMFHGKIIVI